MELLDLIMGLVDKWPVLSSVFLVIGVLRSINKPLFSFLRTFVLATPSKKDDLILDGIEASKIYKVVAYVLDWFSSVKLPDKSAK
jgi:hypothetical protein